MVKAYLRYVLQETFGVVASPQCNAIFLDAQCRLAASGCLENLSVWNLKQALQVTVMKGESASATCLAASPDRKHIAAGYAHAHNLAFVRVMACLTRPCLLVCSLRPLPQV